jgi:hypothetical protein
MTAIGTDRTGANPLQRTATRKAKLLPQAIEAYAAHLRRQPQTRKAARYSAAVLQRVAREERSPIWTSQVYRERLERLRQSGVPEQAIDNETRIVANFLSFLVAHDDWAQRLQDAYGAFPVALPGKRDDRSSSQSTSTAARASVSTIRRKKGATS